MFNRSARTTAFAVALMLVFAATQAPAGTLFDDDFDNGVLADGPEGSVDDGFENVNSPGGSVTEAGTTAQITTGEDLSAAGIVSTRSFDPTLGDGFTATFVVASQTGAGTGFNKVELGVQESTGFNSTADFHFRIRSNGTWAIIGNDGGGDQLLFDGPSLTGGVPDGYTVTLSADAAGWEVSGAGFTSNPNQTGAWSGGFDYTDFSNDMHLVASIQNDGGADTVNLKVNSITLSQPDTPFRNGGFEDYDNGVDDAMIRSREPVSWVETADSPNVAMQTENFGALPHAGDYFATFIGQPDGGSGIAQTFDTVAGQLYEVSFWISRNEAANVPTLELDIFDGKTGLDGSGDGDLVDTEYLISTAEEVWVQQMVQFVAGSSTTTIRFQEPITGNSSGVGPLLDSVSVTAVPTPAALPAGLMLLGAWTLRRKR